MDQYRVMIWVCVCALSLSFGCDETSGDPDTGPMGEDAGPMAVDSGPGDAGPDEDAGNPCDVCGVDETCVRGVCLVNCGADLSTFDAALAADLVAVATYCREASLFGAGGTPFSVYDVTTSSIATGTSFELSSWTLDAPGAVSASVIGAAEASHASDVLLFTGGYLAVAPGGGSVAFGYTLGDATFSGQIFEVLSADGTARSVDAPGNFDVAWLDDVTFLVNGAGLGGDTGQALYAGIVGAAGITTMVVGTNLGDYSGSVEVGPDYVLVGASRSDFSNIVYTIPRAEVEAVIAGSRGPVDIAPSAGGEGTPVVCSECGLASSFEVAGARVITKRYDASFAIEALVGHMVEGYTDATGLTLGAPTDLTTGATFTDAYPADGGGTLLRFAGGLLLAE